MFWIFLVMFAGVIGAKYFTALGTRNLEQQEVSLIDDIAAAVMRF